MENKKHQRNGVWGKMEELIQSIDNIWVFEQGEERRVKIRGWVLAKEDKKSRVVVEKTEFMKEITVTAEERMDVGKKYYQYGDKIDTGFVCEIVYPATTNKNEKIELYLQEVNSKERKKFFSKTIRQLEKSLMMPQIKYRIERIEYMLGKMTVTGWAYASEGYGTCKRPLIQVQDMLIRWYSYMLPA